MNGSGERGPRVICVCLLSVCTVHQRSATDCIIAPPACVLVSVSAKLNRSSFCRRWRDDTPLGLGCRERDANPFSHRSLSGVKGRLKEGMRRELNQRNTRLLSVSASTKGSRRGSLIAPGSCVFVSAYYQYETSALVNLYRPLGNTSFTLSNSPRGTKTHTHPISPGNWVDPRSKIDQMNTSDLESEGVRRLALFFSSQNIEQRTISAYLSIALFNRHSLWRN